MEHSSLTDLIRVLHYCIPLAVLSYFFGASIVKVVNGRSRERKATSNKKVAILYLLPAIVLAYAAEGSFITAQIFTNGGQYTGKDYNVFALAEVLVWMIILATYLDLDQQRWYPLTGSCVINLIGEVMITTLSINTTRGLSPSERGQICLQYSRAVVMCGLVGVIHGQRNMEDVGTDEEAAPLLIPERNGISTPGSGFGTLENDEAAIIADAEIEIARKDKLEKEKVAKLNARVEQEGDWYKYIRGYSIFFPHLWPSQNLWLILNMVGTALCVLATRALIILTPRQLGIVVTTLEADPNRTFAALGIYFLLVWLNSYSGVKALQTWLWIPVEANAKISLSAASYNHIMDLSCDFHDEKQSGELYTAMSQGSSLVKFLDMILINLLPIIIDLVLALGYFYVLFDVYLVLIGAATMVVYFWSFMKIVDIAMKVHRKYAVSARKRYSVMYQTMGEWRTVSYFNRIPHAKRLYLNSVSITQKLSNRMQYISQLGFGANEMTLQIGGLGALFFAAYQVIHGVESVGSFVTLLYFWWTFTDPIQQLARMHNDLLEDLVEAEELLSLFRRQPTVQDQLNDLELSVGRVVFDGVKFNYNGKDSLINGLDFTADPGKTIALIGETGAGKSTVLKLLFRFYDVVEGSISIDGQDIRNVSLRSLRENIGVVPQDASLFNDTVIANLRYARLDATGDEVMEACKAAAIHDRIMSFPEGYNTKVGEKGQKVSGGELQRIAIARAILKDPKIILLDEATSSVDNETEIKIQEGLNRLCKGRTTFVVAHRLSTIMDADKILVIKDGSIVEQGAPSDLLKKKGSYYKLWSKQMGIMDVMAKAENSDTLIDTSTGSSSSGETLPGVTTGTAESRTSNTTSHKTEKYKTDKKRSRPDAPDLIPSDSLASSLEKSASTLNLEYLQGSPHVTEQDSNRIGAKEELRDAQSTSNGENVTDQANRKHRTVSRSHDDTHSDPTSYGLQNSSASESKKDQNQVAGSIVLTPPKNQRRVSAPNDTASDQTLGKPRSGNARRKRQRQARNVTMNTESDTASGGASSEHNVTVDK